MRVRLIYNKTKENAIAFYEQFKEYLLLKNIEIVEEENLDDISVIVIIGGDGTLLHASKQFINIDIPILAINMGSLGFLTDVKEEEAIEMFEKVIKGEHMTEERQFLEVSFNDEKLYALNDAVIAKSGILARMVKIRIFSNGQYINTYRADGIIIATPTGSTAYSLSSGGPIIKPDLNALVINPIAPHTLSARPIVISGNDVLACEILEKHRDVHLMIDGQESKKVYDTDIIKITLSDKKIKLVKPEKRDYYSILREKLKWGDKLC